MFRQTLSKLNQREVTGNAALDLVDRTFMILNAEESKWFSRILLKDLKAGITEKTINKVFKNMIPVFQCMLAEAWKNVKKKPKKVSIEPKLDGYRALAFNYPDDVVLRTRNGKLIEGFTEIEEQVSHLPKGFVYDSEITGKDDHFKDMQEQVFSHQKSKQGIFNVFDLMPIEEFNAGKSKEQLMIRKAVLKEFVESARSHFNLPDINLVEFSQPLDIDDLYIDELYDHYLTIGYEGIMLKDVEGYYVCKRSTSWAKMKPTDTYDLPVIGYEEGKNDFSGMLGAFIVDYNGFPVHVGSGFNLQKRAEYWNKREEMIGRIVELRAQEATTNKKGECSLRFPVFLRIREDK
jgi:DNA ligase-1